MKPLSLITIAAVSLSLVACGGSDAGKAAGDAPASAAKPAKGKGVTIHMTGLEDGKTSDGLFAACRLSYTVKNALKDEIKYLNVEFRPIAVEGDANAASAISTRGKRQIYMGALKAGDARESYQALEGLTCDRVDGLTIISRACGVKSGDLCTEKVGIDNDTRLNLVEGE